MESYLGEVRMFFGNFAPRGWAFCDGQILKIAQNNALFSIIGTIYGGDGRTTFALPNLKGKAVLHPDASKKLGLSGGSNETQFMLQHLPMHSHAVKVGSNATPSQQTSPDKGVLTPYAGPFSRDASPDSHLGGIAQKVVGTDQPIPLNVTNAYQGVNYIICLAGSYPSRS